MKSLIVLGRSIGAGLALVLLGFFVAHAANSPFWGNNTPGTTGPWLGDGTFNISSLYVAHARQAGIGFFSYTTISQTSAQANCTQLANDGLIEAKTSASTGYFCLPSAIAGKTVHIGNATGQTIDLYSSVTPGVPGGATDTINGTAGTTPYTGMTTGKNVICFAANNGAWYCGAIS